jgi:hypothetical protein
LANLDTVSTRREGLKTDWTLLICLRVTSSFISYN